MLPIGSLVNAAAIIAGSLIGLLLHNRFPERVRSIVFQGLGLCVLVVGMQMALKTENAIIVIFSVLIGGISGELMNLEGLFEILANRFKAVVRSKNADFTDGLITASLIFCIGAMAVVGAFDEALRGDRTLYFTKSILDGFASVALASTYGSGVLFSFLPVLLYQGSLTLFAGALQQYFTPHLIAQLTGTGGILILGIGFTLLDIKRVRLSNLLPALAAVVVLTLLFG